MDAILNSLEEWWDRDVIINKCSPGGGRRSRSPSHSCPPSTWLCRAPEQIQHLDLPESIQRHCKVTDWHLDQSGGPCAVTFFLLSLSSHLVYSNKVLTARPGPKPLKHCTAHQEEEFGKMSFFLVLLKHPHSLPIPAKTLLSVNVNAYAINVVQREIWDLRLWGGTSRSKVFGERLGQTSEISFLSSMSHWSCRTPAMPWARWYKGRKCFTHRPGSVLDQSKGL